MESGGEFSEASFERKLVELRESQKEIQALSTYCIHHRSFMRSFCHHFKLNILFNFFIDPVKGMFSVLKACN